MKIGEPNINCAYIPLNPTYYMNNQGLAVGWVEVTKPNIKMTGLNPAYLELEFS
jgi:hypothetical protein